MVKSVLFFDIIDLRKIDSCYFFCNEKERSYVYKTVQNAMEKVITLTYFQGSGEHPFLFDYILGTQDML